MIIFRGKNRDRVLDRMMYLIRNLEPNIEHELDIYVRHQDEWVMKVLVHFTREEDYHKKYRKKLQKLNRNI